MSKAGNCRRGRSFAQLTAAKASIAASALRPCAKWRRAIWSGSLSLLFRGGPRRVDTGRTVITYFAVREAISQRTPKSLWPMFKIESSPP